MFGRVGPARFFLLPTEWVMLKHRTVEMAVRDGTLVLWTDQRRRLEWRRNQTLHLYSLAGRHLSERKADYETAVRVQAEEYPGMWLMFANPDDYPVVTDERTPDMPVVYDDIRFERGQVAEAYGREYEDHMRRLERRFAMRVPLFGDGPFEVELDESRPVSSVYCVGCDARSEGNHSLLWASGWVKRKNLTVESVRNGLAFDHLCGKCYDEYGWGDEWTLEAHRQRVAKSA